VTREDDSDHKMTPPPRYRSIPGQAISLGARPAGGLQFAVNRSVST
jgi:hypothetical protein